MASSQIARSRDRALVYNHEQFSWMVLGHPAIDGGGHVNIVTGFGSEGWLR